MGTETSIQPLLLLMGSLVKFDSSRELNHVLNAGRLAHQEFAVRIDGVASRDERLNRVGPALFEFAQVANRVTERLRTGIHGSDDGLVLQRNVAHNVVSQDLDGGFLCRNTREDVNAIHAQNAHHIEGCLLYTSPSPRDS